MFAAAKFCFFAHIVFIFSFQQKHNINNSYLPDTHKLLKELRSLEDAARRRAAKEDRAARRAVASGRGVPNVGGFF